jgi:hypothetical protein
MSQLDTLAKVFSLVQQGLNAPADPSFLLQVKRAVHESCALYMTELIQSDQNQIIKKTAEIPFVDRQTIYSLDDYPDMTMPDWVEVRTGDDTIEPYYWELVDVVNRDSLPLYQERVGIACSFYSEQNDSSRPFLSKKIEWSYIPQVGDGGLFRVWYDPTISIATSDNAATGFPQEYNYLIAIEARLKLIPILMQMDVQSMADNETSEFVLKAKMSTWSAMQAQAVAEREVWAKKWKHYCLASRTNQGGGVRLSVVNAYM